MEIYVYSEFLMPDHFYDPMPARLGAYEKISHKTPLSAFVEHVSRLNTFPDICLIRAGQKYDVTSYEELVSVTSQ